MNERLRFIVAGFFVGLAEILPGISGSTIAIAFNVYQKFILFLSNLKVSNLSLKYKELNRVFFLDLIIPFLFSMALSVILLSNLIMFLFSEYTYYFLVFLGSLMCSFDWAILVLSEMNLCKTTLLKYTETKQRTITIIHSKTLR